MLLIFLVTLLVHGAFMFRTLSKYDYDPSAFISMDELYFNLYKPLFHSKMIVVGSGYDAMFYYLVASDIRAEGQFEKSYYYRRIMLPAAMYCFSLGRQQYFPLAFIIISLLSTLAAAVMLAAYLSRHGISPWWALGFSLFPGAIIATQFVGADCMALAFTIGALLVLEDGRRVTRSKLAAGLLLLMCAMLTKEPDLIFAGLIFLHVYKFRRFKAALPYLAPIAGFVLWSYYVERRVFPAGDYQIAEAFRYNFSKGLFTGFFDLFYRVYVGSLRFPAVKYFEDLIAPLLFLGFCLFTGAVALFKIPKAKSVFIPAGAVLAATILFARYPLVNLYSCLRVQLATVICFFFILNGWRAVPRKIAAYGFCAAVVVADLFLFFAPAQSYFYVIPGK